MGRLAPHVAVVAVAGVRRDRSRFALASRELPEALRQHELTPLVLVHGDERSRVVALPFASSARQPLAVVKFYRQPPADAAADEQAVLEAIRQRVGERLRATIPQPLGVLRTGSVVATAETFLPGEWLHARWQRRNLPLSDLREDLELVAEWLTDFHLESRVETRRWTENDVERWLEHPLTGYERAFGPTEAESRLFTEARRRARDVRGVPIPVVWQHRDFSSLNILRTGGSIHVVDWEGASLGPPLDDLLYFATRWLHRARHSTRADAALAFRQLLLDPRYRDPAVDAVRGVISRYARALDIDGRLLPLLLLEPWLRRALGRLGRQGTPRWPAPSGKRGAGRVPQAAAGADPRLGNRYVEYVEALAEAPEALFAYSA
jgi:aminoglycoside phosphotransferase (APT) family kinase protein